MKEKKLKRIAVILGIMILLMILAVPAFAAEEPVTTIASNGETISEASSNGSVLSWKAIACAIAIAIPAGAGAIAMAIATGKAAEGIARQPEAAGNIRTSTMLGLVFIETAIIYALLAVILIIFVL